MLVPLFRSWSPSRRLTGTGAPRRACCEALESRRLLSNAPPTAVFVGFVGDPNVPVGFTIAEPVKVATLFIEDDGLGEHVVSLAGEDAGLFSVTPGDPGRFNLILSPAATAELATVNTISVTINVDDPAVGAAVDASAAYSVASWNVGPADHLPLIASLDTWASPVVTYSFEDSGIDPNGLFSGPGGTFQEADKQVARAAFAEWDAASGLTLIESTAGTGDIRLFVADLDPGVAGAANFPVNVGLQSVAVDLDFRTDFLTWAHEVGHALGLLHSFPEPDFPGAGVDPRFDNASFTVMSYTAALTPVSSLGPLDRAAAAELFGPDAGAFSYRPVDIEFTAGGTTEVASFSVSDEADVGTFVGGILRVEFDSPDGLPERPVRSMTLSDSAGGRFRLDPLGNIVVDAPLDFGAAAFHDVVVRVVDGYGGIFEETVRIHVIDGPLPPPPLPVILGTESDDRSLVGSPFGEEIRALGGDDVISQSAGGDTIDGGDGNDTFVLRLPFSAYTLATNDDGSVSVSYDFEVPNFGRVTGTDTLRNVEVLDFRADGILLAVADLFNAAPTDILLAGGNVAENAAPGTVVGVLTGVDPDGPGESLTFTLADDAGGRFVVAGDLLLVAPGAELDFESAASHEVRVRVVDGGGLAYEEAFPIAVTNVAGVTLDGSNRDDRGAGALAGTGEEDVIRGLNGRDELRGLAGNDLLDGGNGDDTLHGGDGDDVLSGGRGDDMLSGGDGNDTYVVARGGGTDTIAGFADGDVIRLSGLRITSAEQVLRRVRYVDGNAILSLAGANLVILDVAPGSLAADHFTFG